jgi:transcriptional regulator with XRE-family HTH domain
MTNGKQLKKLRESLGLSQQALSNLLGVSLQTIWRHEHDKFEIDPDTLKLIPILHAGKVPTWCKASPNKVAELADHIRECEDCRLVLGYLNLKAKK